MINVLSIDWDYYVDTSNEIRERCFPKILNDIISEEKRIEMWRESYKKYNIKNIGILEEKFQKTIQLIEDIEKDSPKACKITNDSHRFVYDVIEKEIEEFHDENIKVYNIDHHHDMYQYRTSFDKVNCSNWAEILQEELGSKFDYNWIKRDDSEEYSLAGKVNCKECFLDDITEKKFDVIYLCRSGAWSPPHLDNKYNELKKCLLKK